jgi:hypothetical protein
MASIEESVRTMLTGASTLNAIPNERITFGYRLYNTALPAITFTLQEAEFATLGGDMRVVQAEFAYICNTALEAAEAEPDMRAAIRDGKFDNNDLVCLFGSCRVEEPVTGDGDEQQPAQLIVTATIYYELN